MRTSVGGGHLTTEETNVHSHLNSIDSWLWTKQISLLQRLKCNYPFLKYTNDVFNIQRGQLSPNSSPKMANDRTIIQQTQSRRYSLSGTWGGTWFCSGNDMPIFIFRNLPTMSLTYRGQHSPHTLPKMGNGLVFRTMFHKSRRYSLPGTWSTTGLSTRKDHQYSARKYYLSFFQWKLTVLTMFFSSLSNSYLL